MYPEQPDFETPYVFSIDNTAGDTPMTDKTREKTLEERIVSKIILGAPRVRHGRGMTSTYARPIAIAILPVVLRAVAEWLEVKYHYRMLLIGTPENPPDSTGRYKVHVADEEIATLREGKLPEGE